MFNHLINSIQVIKKKQKLTQMSKKFGETKVPRTFLFYYTREV